MIHYYRRWRWDEKELAIWSIWKRLVQTTPFRRVGRGLVLWTTVLL